MAQLDHRGAKDVRIIAPETCNTDWVWDGFAAAFEKDTDALRALGGTASHSYNMAAMAGIRPDPWQTDTSIGDWYYDKNWKYRGADWVIHMLVDIVSKNGNLLINVVQRPDGSLDPEAEQVLEQMAAWIAINGEGIYETRPWLVHGEGPVMAKGGHFGEDFAYTAKDIRFTIMGAIEVKQVGVQMVRVRPRDAKTWKAVNLRWVKLTKETRRPADKEGLRD